MERSGNPDPVPNPNIAELGKQYQFGQPGGPDPREAAYASHDSWSVRRAVKYFMRQEWRFEKDAPALDDQAKKLLGRNLTGAERMALVRIRQGFAGNYKFNQSCTEDVDGKLLERKVEAQVSLADLVNGSYLEGDENKPKHI